MTSALCVCIINISTSKKGGENRGARRVELSFSIGGSLPEHDYKVKKLLPAASNMPSQVDMGTGSLYVLCCVIHNGMFPNHTAHLMYTIVHSPFSLHFVNSRKDSQAHHIAYIVVA